MGHMQRLSYDEHYGNENSYFEVLLVYCERFQNHLLHDI
jgi:hypothetical protein